MTKRINLNTGEPFSRGDTREDGMVFFNYVPSIGHHGLRKEYWGTLEKLEAKKRGEDEKKKIRVSVYNRNALESCSFADEWHPDKNQNFDTGQEKLVTDEKVWWKCSSGHEWQASPSTRKSALRKGTAKNLCPYCAHQAASADYNLQTERPDVAKLWNYQKNVSTPEEFLPKSGVSKHWICGKNPEHQWEMPIAKVRSCPFCPDPMATSAAAPSRPSPQYNFATEFSAKAKLWDYKRNNRKPEDFLPKSAEKVYWKCEKGHECSRSLYRMALAKNVCPVCSKRVLSKSNNFATAYPDAAKEFDLSKNSGLKPTDIRPYSSNSFWWKCSNGHEWKATAYQRGYRAAPCPRCRQQENSLLNKYPQIAREWHPNKNDKTPDEVTWGGSYLAWWQCDKGHDWQATVNTRTNMGSGCPKCSNQSSREEIRLLAELSWIFPSVKSRFKVNGKELDIFIEELAIGVEFDGSHWHQNKEDTDRKKNDFMAQHGIKVFRFRESPLEKIEEHDICIGRNEGISKAHVDDFLRQLDYSPYEIEKYLDKGNFVNEEMYLTYLDYFPSPFPEHSFGETSPDIAQQWHPNKNGPLTPYNFSKQSGYRAWWKCGVGHEWLQTIHARVGMSVGCPYCSGRLATNDNNLSITHPDVARLWHPTKNKDVQAQQVKYGSGKIFWWQCDRNPEHEWQKSPIQITKKLPPLCPYCALEIDAKIIELVKSGEKISKVARDFGLSASTVKNISQRKSRMRFR